MKALRYVLVAALISISGFNLGALDIKVGSLAPSDTPWEDALVSLANKWQDISDGELEVKIYASGIAGDEADMLRKVRLGDRLQGAALSGTGLNRISSELLVMSLPFFFESYDELEYVMEQVTPYFEDIVSKKGFKLVGWTTAGWVHFFGKKPIVTPQDLKDQKLAVSAEDEEILYTWRAMGFDATPLHTTEVLTGLQTGMVEAFHTPPIVAAVFQWFGVTPHMSNFQIAPLIAGFVVNGRTWRRVSDEYKEELLAVADEALKPLYSEVEELEKEAIQIMKDNGLEISPFPESARQEWLDLVDRGYEKLIGSAVSEETFEYVKGVRDEYRARHGGE